jgi:integrase
MLPKNPVVPKAKMPPSVAKSQYPPPLGVVAMPVIGWFDLDEADVPASPGADEPIAGGRPFAASCRLHQICITPRSRAGDEVGVVSRNVATLVSPPRGERAEIRPFDPEEARQFLDAVRGDRLEALYSVALAVGLRQGEALGLRCEDVDFDRRTLTVRHALQLIDGEFRLFEPKTRLSRRTIDLPPRVVARLRAHKGRQGEEELAAKPGNWKNDLDLVFTTQLGRPLNASNVTHRFQRKLERAGQRRQRFHDLRHACASPTATLSPASAATLPTGWKSCSQSSTMGAAHPSRLLPRLLPEGSQ